MKYNFSFKILVLRSLIFMIFLYAVFLSLRVLFISFYFSAVKEASFDEFVLAFHNAFWYDGQIIGVLSALYFVLALLFKNRFFVLEIYTFLVILVSVFVVVANIGFYEIYADMFNATLLGLIFDDRAAILKTAQSGDFNLGFKILLWLILSFAFYLLLRLCFKALQRHCKTSFASFKFVKNSALFLLFFFCALFAINGHFGFKGISLGKELVPVENAFLRKLSVGSFRDLLYVYKGYVKIFNSKFSDYNDESVLEATKNFFKLDSNETRFDLSKLLEKEVQGNNQAQINHIFYIIAESLSEWHFDEEFKELDLMHNLNALINDKKAFKADIFIQNAPGTIKSLDVQISGLFQIEIPFNLSVGKSPVFKTSPGFIFKDLGYKTRFYYAGSGTWQKIDVYTASQGFDEILYNTQIIQNAKEKGAKAPYANAWGAFDHYTYDFVKDYTLKNKDEKSFSMILTTSYHPPYDLPLDEFDIPWQRIDTFVNTHKEITNKELARKVFSHIYYQDQMIAKFINETSKILPDSLFIITGDHYDMKYPYPLASIKTSNSIPLIVYSPKLQPKVLFKAGSHLDITPTITELVAPKGYKFASFGQSLLSNDKAVKIGQKENLGYFAVSNDRFIYDGFKLEYFQDKKALDDDENEAKELFKQLQRAKALSWWIFTKGYEVSE
ncbi:MULTISPECIES: LTA synthase family protein [unclassified Campylobacter]|uniref:LTA synthase family protein n=1 Tax=unclassified Campylobacter TaxID=2593542 RepID=UPI001EE47191|nr:MULTISPECIES: alkaline phosphatase family protein [unclassified Campylobacter]